MRSTLMHCIVGIVHTCKFVAGKVQGHKFARTKLSILVREATVSWPGGYSEQGFDLRLLIVATLVQVIDLCGDAQGNRTEPVYRALWQDGCCWWCDVEFPPKILLKEVWKAEWICTIRLWQCTTGLYQTGVLRVLTILLMMVVWGYISSQCSIKEVLEARWTCTMRLGWL